MTTTYQLRIDRPYIRELLRASKGLTTPVASLIKWLVVSLIGGFCAIALSFDLWGTFLSIVGAVLLLTAIPRLYWFWRNRRTPARTLRVALNEDGVRVSSEHIDSLIQYSGFRSARMHADGVLLVLDRKRLYWLPDRAITAGSAQQARELVTTHVKNHTLIK